MVHGEEVVQCASAHTPTEEIRVRHLQEEISISQRHPYAHTDGARKRPPALRMRCVQKAVNIADEEVFLRQSSILIIFFVQFRREESAGCSCEEGA